MVFPIFSRYRTQVSAAGVLFLFYIQECAAQIQQLVAFLTSAILISPFPRGGGPGANQGTNNGPNNAPTTPTANNAPTTPTANNAPTTSSTGIPTSSQTSSSQTSSSQTSSSQTFSSQTSSSRTSSSNTLVSSATASASTTQNKSFLNVVGIGGMIGIILGSSKARMCYSSTSL